MLKKRIFTFFLCILFMMPTFAAAGAAELAGQGTVRAGIFFFDGYHMKDERGNLTGYGIEFLNLVSEYSHLNFEYVGYDRSWNDMLVMLENGEIDLVTSARKTNERENSFAFSIPIGRNNTVLSVRADDSRFRSGDYKSYDGMTVGILAGSSQNQSLAEFALEKGFSYQAREYQDSDRLTADLQAQRIDAILTSNLRKVANEKTLDTIESDDFYVIVRKEDAALLNEVNYAVEQMNLNEGDWSNVLFYKYYGQGAPTGLSFTAREQAYIRAVAAGEKKITVTSMGDRMPYSYIEDQQLTGILPEYFAQIMETAGLPYEIVLPDSRAAYYELVKDNSVDVVIDRRISNAEPESYSQAGFLTSSYMTTGIARVSRKDFSGTVSTVAIAEDQGDAPIEHSLIGDAQILDYPTREQALQAVLEQRADAAYVYTYTAQMFVNNDFTDALHFSIINDMRYDFRMYVRSSCDHELVTILNKCIRQMPEDALTQLVTKYTSYAPGHVTFARYVRSHPGVLAAVILAAALAVGLIVFFYLRASWNKKILQTATQANLELEKQLAIVDVLSRDYRDVYGISLQNGMARTIKAEGHISAPQEAGQDEELPYASLLQPYIAQQVAAEDRQELAEALSLDKIISELERNDEYSGTYRVLMGGKEHHFQFTCVKVQENNGFILAGFRNIDDIVRKEQEQKAILAEALAEAQHANASKTTFLNNMSHDIRTPMNAIIGFTSLAMSHITNQEQVENYLGKILTSGKHLLSLINDVLDMSRIESGKVKIEEKEASLPEILHDLKTIVQADVKAKQLDFFVDTLDVVNETIICDKLRLNQVLLNILSNAMKYTKPGGSVRVRIIQTADAPEGYASYQFVIQDTGIGMSQKFLKHLFEPFEREQTATISGIQGTGLGLAITKNIVDMMNGSIQVDSEEGKGTTFTVSFQFRTVDDAVKPEHMDQLVNQHVLVVDDDTNVCTSVSRMLSSFGMRPDWTTQGREAVIRTEFAQEQGDPFDVYLIDWQIPDMNGIEAVRRIRRLVGDAVPIILVTAYDWSDMEQEAREAGVTAFCSKPLFLSELQEVLTAPYRVQEEEPAGTSAALERMAGKKLLLVEDNELNQEIAQTILEEAGFVIDTACDGTEAVHLMETGHTYDLILMDIQMPLMDGYAATRAIRALDSPNAAVPIVAMTANAFEEDRQRAISAGMDGHVSKPIDIPQLMETLDKILGS